MASNKQVDNDQEALFCIRLACVWQRLHLSLSFLSLVSGVAPVPSVVVRTVSPCQDQQPWFTALTCSLPVWAAESGATTCFRFLTCFWAARVGLGVVYPCVSLSHFQESRFFPSVQKYMEGQVFALNHQKAFHDIPGPPDGAREEVLGGGPERFWRTRSVQVKSTSITKLFTKQRNLNQHRLNRLLEGFHVVSDKPVRGSSTNPGQKWTPELQEGGWVGGGVSVGLNPADSARCGRGASWWVSRPRSAEP